MRSGRSRAGLWARPYAVAGGVYNYCPAGYTPVTPPNTLPPNITGVGYCQPLVAPVAFTQPVTTRVAYVVPRRAVSRVAYAYPRRALARRVAFRTRAYGYRRVGFRTGPALGYRRVGFRTRASGRLSPGRLSHEPGVPGAAGWLPHGSGSGPHGSDEPRSGLLRNCQGLTAVFERLLGWIV